MLNERHRIPEDVSIKLQQYLAKMKTKRRIEIAISISFCSFFGIFWIWILAILWMPYRRIEEEFVSLWLNFPNFNPEGQFRTVFKEETYPLLTDKTFLNTLRRKNSIKMIFMKVLAFILVGYAMILMILMFLFLPIVFLSTERDKESTINEHTHFLFSFLKPYTISSTWVDNFSVPGPKSSTRSRIDSMVLSSSLLP